MTKQPEMQSISSTLYLSEGALANNLEFIRSLLPPQVRFSSVVKGNAYGHGIEEFIPMAEAQGVRHFSVFSSKEARRVFNVKKPATQIMIMGYIEPSDYQWVIEHEIDFYLFEAAFLPLILQTAKSLNKRARLHLELETGMNRIGVTRQQLRASLPILKAERAHLRVVGLCTHYAGAESIANHVRVENQYERFNKLVKMLHREGIVPDILHTACSAATLAYPKMQMDMVRIGILQYGFWPSRESYIRYWSKYRPKCDPLRRVITWKSCVMSIKSVKMGEFVSYGTTYLAERDMRVAIVPVGYANGYSRSLSNQGRVLIRGIRLGVIGFVNMNMLIVKLPKEGKYEVGEEVVLIGHQGDNEVTVSSFGELSNQLNYELLTRLPHDILRKKVK